MDRKLAYYNVRIHLSNAFNEHNFRQFVSLFDDLKAEADLEYDSLVERIENLKISDENYVEKSSEAVHLNKLKNAKLLNTINFILP